jgi:hypothetical protein
MRLQTQSAYFGALDAFMSDYGTAPIARWVGGGVFYVAEEAPQMELLTPCLRLPEPQDPVAMAEEILPADELLTLDRRSAIVKRREELQRLIDGRAAAAINFTAARRSAPEVQDLFGVMRAARDRSGLPSLERLDSLRRIVGRLADETEQRPEAVALMAELGAMAASSFYQSLRGACERELKRMAKLIGDPASYCAIAGAAWLQTLSQNEEREDATLRWRIDRGLVNMHNAIIGGLDAEDHWDVAAEFQVASHTWHLMRAMSSEAFEDVLRVAWLKLHRRMSQDDWDGLSKILDRVAMEFEQSGTGNDEVKELRRLADVAAAFALRPPQET